MDDGKMILVPFDFTPLAYMALEHGACWAKALNEKLVVLNITDREKNIPSVETKLKMLSNECDQNYGVKPEAIVRVGSRPYAMIKTVAEELKPSLVVLKTGGVHGIRHYTGIRTIKILSGTKVPFLVIQGPPANGMLQNIAFPINFLRNHDYKMQRVVYLAQFYPEATMHILTPSGKGTDKEKVIATNIKVMTKVLDDENIKSNFMTIDKKHNYAEDIIDFARGVHADLIVNPTRKKPLISKFLFGLREEKLIANAHKIPVMCVHRSYLL